MNYEGTPVKKTPLCPKKKDDDAIATAELLFVSGVLGRRRAACSKKCDKGRQEQF